MLGLSGTNEWTLSLSQEFAGESVRSAFVKGIGVGKLKAEWKAELPEAGKYEIFVHRPCVNANGYFSAHRGVKNYYTVYVSDRKEEVVLDVEDNLGKSSWESLGVFTLPAGESRVVLDDRGTSEIELYGAYFKQLVVADAVKWVKK